MEAELTLSERLCIAEELMDLANYVTPELAPHYRQLAVLIGADELRSFIDRLRDVDEDFW